MRTPSSASAGTARARRARLAAPGLLLAAALLAGPSATASNNATTAQSASQSAAAAVGDGPAAYHGTVVSGDNPGQAPQNTALQLSNGDALVLQAHDVGHDAAEPTIGADASGAVFYAAAAFDGIGGTAKTTVFRSTDSGQTWQKVSPSIADTEEHQATLDPYIDVDPVGRVFDVDLLLAGSHLSFSDDQGRSWTTTALTVAGVNDHQTLAAGPPPAGNPALQPVDPRFPKIVYYCVNQASDSGCARSLDGGRTFAQTATPAFLGVDPAAGGVCGGLHGQLVADADGRIFLPKDHCGFPWTAVSDNGGDTWTRVQVSDKIGEADVDPAVAVDSAGNVYEVWWDDEHHLPYLSLSRDHGRTWSAPRMIAPPGVHEVNFPTVTAGDPGRIAITFPGTTVDNRSDPTRPWSSYVVVSSNALDTDPVFLSNIANSPDDPVHRGECTGRCAGMFDFLDIQVSPADGTAWASAVDTCTGDCVTNPSAPADSARGIAIQALNVPLRTVTR